MSSEKSETSATMKTPSSKQDDAVTNMVTDVSTNNNDNNSMDIDDSAGAGDKKVEVKSQIEENEAIKSEGENIDIITNTSSDVSLPKTNNAEKDNGLDDNTGEEVDKNDGDGETDKDVNVSTSKQSLEKSNQDTMASENQLSQPQLKDSAVMKESMHPDRRKAAVFLSHRKMILFRLRQCQKAAQERLLEYQNTDEKNQLNDISEKNDNESNQEDGQNSAHKNVYCRKIYKNQEEEINAYNELQTYAISFSNRRQTSSSSQVIEPGIATRISLRTGSSVGNKMKAAVAALTNNSARASLSPFSDDNIVDSNNGDVSLSNLQGKKLNLPQHLSIGEQQKSLVGNKGVGSVDQIPASSSSVTMANASGSENLQLQPSVGNQNLSKGKQLKKKKRSSSKRSLPTGGNHMSSSSTPTNDIGVNQMSSNVPLHHHGMMNANNNSYVSGDSWSRDQYSNTHLSSLKSMDPYNLNAKVLSQKFPPRILCPEADRLRKKRKQIESNLQTIFKKRYLSSIDELDKNHIKSLGGRIPSASPTSSMYDHSQSRSMNQATTQQSSSFQQPLSTTTPNDNPYFQYPSKSDRLSSVQWKQQMSLGGLTPCLLPQRRKTQWDYVLEEMRWLATDFIEERKWKKAYARTISYSVSSHASKLFPSPSRRSTPSTRNSSTNTSMQSSLNKMSTESDHRGSDLSHVKLVKIEREPYIQYPRKEYDTSDEKVGNSEDESAIEDNAGEAQKRRLSDIKFEDPTDDDIKVNRIVSKLLSKVVHNQWNAYSVNAGLSKKEDQNTSYSRLYKLHCELKGDSFVNDDTVKSKENGEDSIVEEVNSASSDDRKQTSFEEIMTSMESCIEFVLKLRQDLPTSYESYEKCLSDDLTEIKLELHNSQIKCLQHVETLFDEKSNSNASGFLLNGPLASGKTFSMCALLWRRRSIGPQLLICSSGSLVRWRHELKRFVGLNVFTVGEVGWSLDMDGFNNSCQRLYGCSDVIICESSNVMMLRDNILKRQQSSFVTVVIDSRRSSTVTSKLERHGCLDLDSAEWWSTVIQNLVNIATKTVIISSTLSISRSQSNADLVQFLKSKKDVELLSLKLAFIQHHLFHSTQSFFGKRVFRWAKRAYQAMKINDNLGNPSKVFENSVGGKGVLCTTIDILTHMHEEVDEDLPSVYPNWSIQFCPLTRTQRVAYEKDCNFVRGSLVGFDNSSSGDKFSSFAKSILRLRRSCFHSNLHTMLNIPTVRNLDQYDSGIERRTALPLEASMSCSQPNLDLAKSILNNSSKLQHLLNILHKDCGCDLNDGSILLTSQSKINRKRKGRKKVLILSSLPDILHVASAFLNSVGIAHQVVMHCHGSDMGYSKHLSSLFWSHCQQAIARFEGQSDLGASEILLSSPEVLGSMSLGLSASNAEVIISLDEDWSGRSDLLTYSILMKNCIQADSSEERKFIKLIAEDTCEESFLTFEKKVKGRSSIYPIPISMHMLQVTSTDEKGFLTFNEDEFMNKGAFLGRNILRCSNMSLSTVLGTDTSLPPLALIGTEQRLLMDLSYNVEDSCELHSQNNLYLKNLGNVVPSLMDDCDTSEINEPDHGRQKSILVGKALVEIEQKATVNACGALTRQLSGRGEVFINASKCTVSARDVISKEVQGYICDFKELTQFSNRVGDQKVLKVIPSKSGSITAQKQKTPKSKLVSREKTVNDSRHRKSLGSSAEKVLSSLLLYKGKQIDQVSGEDFNDDNDLVGKTLDKQNILKSINQDNEEGDMRKKRKNAYAIWFSSLYSQLDSHQGTESMMYFPPLFPGLRVGKSFKVKDDASNPIDRMSSKKRKIHQDDYPASKKLRASKSLHSPGKTSSFPSSFSTDVNSSLPINQKDMTNDLNLIAATDLIEQSDSLFDDDFLPDLALDKTSDFIETKVSLEEEHATEVDEDFGLLGSGFCSEADDTSFHRIVLQTRSNQYSFWLDPFEPTISNVKPFSQFCDTEEASCDPFHLNGPQLDSVILRVKVQNRSYEDGIHSIKGGLLSSMSSSSFTPKMTLPLGRQGLPTLHVNFNSEGTSNLLPVSQSGNKKKRKSDKRNLMPSSLSGSLSSSNVMHNIKGVNPSLTSISHQEIPIISHVTKDRGPFHFSSLIPSSVHYARPYILVQHMLSDVTESDTTTMKHIENLIQHPPIKLLLNNEYTGDLAKEYSISQMKEFDSSPQTKILNFIPFSAGSIVELDRIHESALARVGIKLPMGVKVPYRHFGRAIEMDEKWVDTEDTLLKTSIARYGFNWTICSQTLTWRSGDVMIGKNQVRSSRQCVGRWRGYNQQDTGKDVVDEREKLSDISNSSQVLFGPNETLNQSNPQVSIRKNRFERLKKAASKLHLIPLTVPGSDASNGNQSIQTHPSHPSHLQSVQNAAAQAAGSSGIPAKLEMWPLQFLDVAENRRQHAMNHNQSSVKSPQHATSQHKQRQMQQKKSSSHQHSIPQQRPKNGTTPLSPRNPAAITRGQDITQTQTTYGHPMSNQAPSQNMGGSHR